jgi:hypothetical protein
MYRFHPALWTLLRLRSIGGFRRVFRGVTTVHGAVVFLFGFWIIWQAVGSVLAGEVPMAAVSPERLGELYRSGLLTFVLVGQIKTLDSKAVYFTPSEVDFLFAGPFSRRELLVYRVVSVLGGILVLSAALAFLLLGLGAWWPAVFVATLLSLLFLHQLAMCLGTVRETLEAHAFSLVRRFVILSVVALVLVSIAYGVSLQPGEGALDVLSAAYGTWTMQALLMPFSPFAEVATARSFDPVTLGWIAVCLLVNLAAFVLLVRLDAANPDETAVLNRRDLYQARSSGARRAVRARPVAMRSLLSLVPHMKGIGTIASLQLTHAIRGYRLLIELAVVVLIIAVAFHFSRAGGASDGSVDLTRLVYATIWTTIIISNPLRFDFRGGLHTLEYLKTLPMPAWALCAGQLVTPVMITLLYQLPFLVMASQSLTLGALIIAVAIAIPLNIFWYGLENLGFLLSPSSQSSRGFGDIQHLGRQILMLLTKFALLLVAALVAVGVAIALGKVFMLSQATLVNAIILVLVIEAAALVGLLAWVFTRFDPSRIDPHDS